MNKYALAKLVQWSGSGGLAGRKRLQKVVYFLQAAGCSFDADYALHHYGAYSRDVAEACDELVGAGILVEHSDSTEFGAKYIYSVPSNGQSAIQRTEQRLGNQAKDIEKFEPLAKSLLEAEIWELEFGSTMLFFFEKSHDWDDAVRRACEFKKRDMAKDGTWRSALALAQKIHASKESLGTGIG